MSVENYVMIATSAMAFGACMECIINIIGYVVRSIYHILEKGGK